MKETQDLSFEVHAIISLPVGLSRLETRGPVIEAGASLECLAA